jgi:hypothetical protein
VHVVFHGCRQYAEKIGRAVVEHGGYNRWADTNRLIVLYPQTTPIPGNPFGCWDWWGYTQLPRSDEYARKTGYQIAAIKAMLDRLAEGYAAGVSSEAFGTPQNVSAPDSTSSSVALIWQPNSAAAGFNVYQSLSSAGPYTKRNSVPVKGASFADSGLAPNTTYFYKVTALDQTSVESAPSNPISGGTASQPPACDPYFSDNKKHVLKLRATTNGLNTFAVGSLDPMGPFTDQDFSQLMKESPLRYRVGYCP